MDAYKACHKKVAESVFVTDVDMVDLDITGLHPEEPEAKVFHGIQGPEVMTDMYLGSL